MNAFRLPLPLRPDKPLAPLSAGSVAAGAGSGFASAGGSARGGSAISGGSVRVGGRVGPRRRAGRSVSAGGSVRVGGPGGALRPHRIPVLALREDRSGRRTGRIRRFPHDSAVPTKRPTSAERNDPPRAPFLAPAPAPLLPDAWNTGPMRCVRRTGCDLGRPGPVKRAESPDAGPKRWPPHIFHPPSQAHPVPKWRNDAIPRERKSCRAPESHAPATFSPPRATRHRPARARGAPRDGHVAVGGAHTSAGPRPRGPKDGVGLFTTPFSLCYAPPPSTTLLLPVQ